MTPFHEGRRGLEVGATHAEHAKQTQATDLDYITSKCLIEKTGYGRVESTQTVFSLGLVCETRFEFDHYQAEHAIDETGCLGHHCQAEPKGWNQNSSPPRSGSP